MTGRHLPEGVWRQDRLPNGWRYWVVAARRYSEPEVFRAELDTAMREMVWHPPSWAELPLWSGLGLQEVMRQGRFRMVAGLGVSATPLEYPEDSHLEAYLERGAEPYWATYSLLGIKQLTPDGWQMTYFLDRGLEISGVAVDVVHEQRPEGLSLLCALNRHDECPGSFKPRRWLPLDRRMPCRCECGCRERSQVRAADDPVEQLTEDGDDLEPDGKGGTVAHDKPPSRE
ncbi:hypothetical protein [Nocardia lijiangensis]|uniref:hypothetical protein n=1 Tax=Nocardia lijiangensis TaxID=299618 RepID=UPI000ACD66CF|nr:hypothetical protein [Nocardia lijiangensis]